MRRVRLLASALGVAVGTTVLAVPAPSALDAVGRSAADAASAATAASGASQRPPSAPAAAPGQPDRDGTPPPAAGTLARARQHGIAFERNLAAARRVLHAWLRHADTRTLLLPDRTTDPKGARVYTPHNSGADLYPYLVLTSQLTDPDLFAGRMLEMLRNEIRFTSARASVPGNLDLTTGALGDASLFGAGEYAKDGLVTVTEALGRTPWFARMVDLMADAMAQAPVDSRFGRLPAADTELNGDFLQALARVITMTGDPRALEWARRIGDAYVDEVLPGNGGVPGMQWDFAAHRGDTRLRLRDHGNETIVGLTLLFAIEHQLGSERASRYRPVIQRMLDRVLASAAPDGMLYNEVAADTLRPTDTRLSDNWGYVYGAVYLYYQVTGDAKYRDAVRRVLRALPAYHRHPWEPGRDRPPLGSFDGYADTIESAIYLVNREPVEPALAWIDDEMEVMLGMQRADGHLEDWYGEGNFNRTALLHAYMKSLGVRPAHWEPGVRVGAVRDAAMPAEPAREGRPGQRAARDEGRLVLSLDMPGPRRIQFDFARHRRVLNLQQNFVRLNEFPEWYTVDENTLYRVARPGAAGEVRLGAELVAGIVLAPGDWTIERIF
jgi:hypothetical protein